MDLYIWLESSFGIGFWTFESLFSIFGVQIFNILFPNQLIMVPKNHCNSYNSYGTEKFVVPKIIIIPMVNIYNFNFIIFKFF